MLAEYNEVQNDAIQLYVKCFRNFKFVKLYNFFNKMYTDNKNKTYQKECSDSSDDY